MCLPFFDFHHCAVKRALWRKPEIASNMKKQLMQILMLARNNLAKRQGWKWANRPTTTQCCIYLVTSEFLSKVIDMHRWKHQEWDLSELPSISASPENKFIKNDWFGSLANCQLQTFIHQQEQKGLLLSLIKSNSCHPFSVILDYDHFPQSRACSENFHIILHNVSWRLPKDFRYLCKLLSTQSISK